MHQVRKLIRAPMEVGAFFDEPVEEVLGFAVADEIHLGEEIGLVEVFDRHTDCPKFGSHLKSGIWALWFSDTSVTLRHDIRTCPNNI